MNQQEKEKVEAATFRRLLDHFSHRTDVQNLDLMNSAGFCRNCLSRWFSEEAGKQGLVVDSEAAKKIVYGMPYTNWKERYQKERTKEEIDDIMNYKERIIKQDPS